MPFQGTIEAFVTDKKFDLVLMLSPTEHVADLAALHRKKIVHLSAKKPLIFHWVFAPVSTLFAVVDFIRRPFAKTSQLFILLGREDQNS